MTQKKRVSKELKRVLQAHRESDELWERNKVILLWRKVRRDEIIKEFNLQIHKPETECPFEVGRQTFYEKFNILVEGACETCGWKLCICEFYCTSTGQYKCNICDKDTDECKCSEEDFYEYEREREEWEALPRREKYPQDNDYFDYYDNY